MDINCTDKSETEISGSKEQLRLERQREIERSIIKKFRKPIWRRFTKAINEYELIKDGDRIAVCISGGKDSMLMAKLFQELARHGKKNFEVVFLVMNPGYNEANHQLILSNAEILWQMKRIHLAISAPGCAEVIYTVRQKRLDAIRLP